MAKNYIQPGSVKDWTNDSGSAVDSGSPVVIGNLLGVALVDIPAGAKGAVRLDGVFENLPKASAATFDVGEKLIFDVSVGNFVGSGATPAEGDITGAAVAWEAGTNGQTSCTAKLTPGNSAIEPAP